MNNELRTKNGFTLVELSVAVGLMAMVFVFAGVIFNVSIDSYRASGANAEIMQKLRAITEQLNADFKGLRKDAPLLVWFRQDTGVSEPNRYDQIMFFADGDFSSIQLYNSGGVPDSAGNRIVRGNVARIHYGQAQSVDPADDIIKDPFKLAAADRLLARRQHILTADSSLYTWPDANSVESSFKGKDGVSWNECYEHDRLSLASWEIIDRDDYKDIIDTCFENRPEINSGYPKETFHKLMCEGVGGFKIQWAYWDENDDRFYWFPSNDPDGEPLTSDSHFGLLTLPVNKFGVYFNVPGTTNLKPDWYSVEDADVKFEPGKKFPSDFYPKALKFTFRLFDSKGIQPKGREFTHIVYLEQ